MLPATHAGSRGATPLLLVLMAGVLAGMGHAMWVQMDAAGWNEAGQADEDREAPLVAAGDADAPEAGLGVAGVPGENGTWMVDAGMDVAWADLEIRTDPAASGLSYRLNEGPARPIDGALPRVTVVDGDVLDLCAAEAVGPVEVLLLHEGEVIHRVVLDSLEAC